MSDEDSSASEGEALLTQGERYLYGTGVPQNCGRAQSSLEAAADRGSSRALSDLGSMYSTGHCVRRDLPTAYRWFVKALHQQPANNRISTDLQVLWNQMTPEEKQAAMKER
jgi:TPR repeat protein